MAKIDKYPDIKINIIIGFTALLAGIIGLFFGWHDLVVFSGMVFVGCSICYAGQIIGVVLERSN
jgi:hypothetical protein